MLGRTQLDQDQELHQDQELDQELHQDLDQELRWIRSWIRSCIRIRSYIRIRIRSWQLDQEPTNICRSSSTRRTEGLETTTGPLQLNNEVAWKSMREHYQQLLIFARHHWGA